MKDKPIDDSMKNPDFVRGVYKDAVYWYTSAESKAQLIITLDGIFLAFVGSGLVGNKELIEKLHWLSASLLLLMVLSVGISIYFGIRCVWSRIWQPDELRKHFNKEGVNLDDYKTYNPNVCWFFQMICNLKKEEFTKRMTEIPPTFEVEALASQAFILSGNVLMKHRYVNYGFFFVGSTLFFFVLSAICIVLEQRGLL